ncbi:hypothetical protein COU15_00970 [Candidatus Kaiserbacteria bacterium CG10_big_fil_rev_8_21_14_0_10_45_20]|uniref:HTH arsR-type domain-containing protein n=1 Tax=Candidatus Kaiserbacteria bacterium CG10_big_fil_rev_8_21_14_0_10_45_20 TaxID=1974607 RepID=A0A2H0UG47_9BACT|nr:MAG: hypothetical protein COU15_00970 [Candidatus Kaiserbacteria bacterium CG10_big_fil_rev_8_21_14_0_10_45_20]
MTISAYILRKRDSEGAISILKILSNKNRYLIMRTLLSAKRDLCVHELSEAVGISQSATSHQLAYLEARGVVKGVRMGKTMCYEPTDTPLTKIVSKIIKSLK